MTSGRTRLVLISLIFVLVLAVPASADILMHYDNATNGTTVFIDETNRTWTVAGSPYGATITKKFGTASIRFNSSLSSSIYQAYQDDFDILNQDDFTIDFWVNMTVDASATAQAPLSFYSSGSDGYFLYYSKSGSDYTLRFYMRNTGVDVDTLSYTTTTAPLTVGQWKHVAIVSNDNDLRMYIDGGMVAQTTKAGTYDKPTGAVFYIGSRPAANYLNGYIDEFRLTNGYARWSANFTPEPNEYRMIWNYTTTGTNSLTVPNLTTRVNMFIGGGGGAGAPGRNTSGSYGYGTGGDVGEFGNISSITVVPGTSYTAIVGDHGVGALGNTMSIGQQADSGNPSSAFGFTKNGGSGGTVVLTATSSQAGEVGDSTYFMTSSLLATSGGTGGGAYEMRGGYGYGAGGGGGASSGVYGNSGDGAPGIIYIFTDGALGENTPDFSASLTSSPIGTAITFTDLSIIRDPNEATYLWDFGDGTTSTTQGNVVHTYSAVGSYTVSLTITSAATTLTTTKESYITVNLDNPPQPQSYPKYVTFFIRNGTGAYPVTGAVVNVTAEASSIGSYQQIADLIGVELANVGINASMYGTTDSLGQAQFYVLPSVRYNVTVTAAGYTFTPMQIYPALDQYTIYSQTGRTVQPTPSTNYVYLDIANATKNATAEFFNVSYMDTSGGTSILTFNVTNASGAILYTTQVDRTGFTNFTNLSSGALIHGTGTAYTARISAVQAQVGFINRTVSTLFPAISAFSDYPSWVGQWVGILVLVIVAGSASFLSVKYVAVILPVLAYFEMEYLGWLTPSVGGGAMVASLGALLTIGVLRYIRESKRKLG